MKAQQAIIDSNIVLINSLEVKYKAPCIKYQERKIKRKVVKIDDRVVDDLNKIYQAQLDFNDVINLLKKLGYNESSRIKNPQRIIDTTLFIKYTDGQLDGYVMIVYNKKESRLISKRIILATKKHFYCETKEWQSYSYIDFIYLRRFIKKIKIPLQIAWSNVVLESK